MSHGEGGEFAGRGGFFTLQRVEAVAAALAVGVGEAFDPAVEAAGACGRSRRRKVAAGSDGFERKAGALTGRARIGRVSFNRTGRTIFYRDHVFHRIVGGSFKSNYYDEATGEDYWISGCKRRGGDQLYATNVPIEIDEDVRVEYWRDIRGMPEMTDERTA